MTSCTMVVVSVMSASRKLQEQCVQDDVRLASHAAELARTVGGAGEGETRAAYVDVAGPSSDHRDDIEKGAPSGCVRHENLTKYFTPRKEVVLAPKELNNIENGALVAKGKLILCLKSIENDAGGSNQSKAGCNGKRVV